VTAVDMFAVETTNMQTHRRIQDFFRWCSKMSLSGCVLTAYQWRRNCSYTVNNHTYFG